MSNKLNPSDKCEVCTRRPIWRHNETVRNKNTKQAKILDICQPCFEKVTGAK